MPINGLEAGDELEEQQQEEQVRRTAQRLICSHLRPDPDASGEPTNPKFWHDISLDLTTATLQDWNLVDCRVHHVRLDRARFLGPAVFDRAEFTGQVRARETVFQHEAWFADTTFRRFVRLDRTEFHAEADFDRAVFEEWLSLSGAVLHGASSFRDVRTADSDREAPSKPSSGEGPPLPGSAPGEYERPGSQDGEPSDAAEERTRDQLVSPGELGSAVGSAGKRSTSDSRDTIRRMQG
ncbi:hypothetical protein J2S53_002667 [Actinopolyspora lacussalsi]|nr:hypothetical protein [Actinopolyspora lacussalsi]